MINTEIKQQITAALNEWLRPEDQERSANTLSKRTGINTSYISNIKNGNYSVGQTSIRDSIFLQIADFIGFVVAKQEQHWNTHAFQRIQDACRKAQLARKIVMLDSLDSGVGKTYALESYAKENDRVIYVKCTSTMNAGDLLTEIMNKLNIRRHVKGAKAKMDEIRMKVTGTPGYLIIIDETDDIRSSLWKFIKEIYDFTRNKCGVIVSGMGTIDKINRMAERNRDGFKQIRRRLFANRIMVGHISKAEIRSIASENLSLGDQGLRWMALNVTDFQMLSEYISDLRSSYTGEQISKLSDRDLESFFNSL